jgi:sigma-E factor negative regulatory protein RseA
MKDRISQLMDGELDERAAGEAIAACGRGGEAGEAWHTYHLIGDAMRETSVLSAGFSARVTERLTAEPTVLAPRRVRPESRTWLALSAAASFAAVALVGWLAFTPQPLNIPAQMAQVEAAGPQEAPAIVPPPSATNDYLLAHQGFSPRVSFQGMTPYVRSVSQQGRERGK